MTNLAWGQRQIGVCTESFTPRFNDKLAVPLTHRKMCQALAAQGWNFLECAPAGFEPPLTELSSGQRRAHGREALELGVPYRTGHWLMSFTPHVLTSPDPTVRAGGTEFLKRLAEALADLGVTRVVFGSPKSRVITPPATDQHFALFAEAVAGAMSAFEAAAIDFHFEFLSSAETAFGNTPADAIKIADMIGHPSARMIHFDIKAASAICDGVEGVCDLMRSCSSRIGYVHFNDAKGGYPGDGAIDCLPGTGERTNFVPIFRTLREIGYTGLASVEMFNFLNGFPGYPVADPLPLLAQSIRYLRNCEAAAGVS